MDNSLQRRALLTKIAGQLLLLRLENMEIASFVIVRIKHSALPGYGMAKTFAPSALTSRNTVMDK